MQPIVNDFFCGCGGMGVGFLNAGYKIAGAWDFDKYAVQSYDHNVGHHVKQADIKQENGKSSLCRLFLPTESELFGDCCYSEDDTYSQIEYYKDRRNRIKCNRKGGSPDWYWTASVRSGDSTYCVFVNYDGGSDGWNASSELCVPVCFVIQ